MPRTRKNPQQRLLIREIKSPKEAFRDLRNYLAGQFVGATRDEVLLDEVLKCLFCKLFIERGSAEPPKDASDAFGLARYVRSVFCRVRDEFPEIYDPSTEILLAPDAIRLVFEECAFSLLDAASDPIGDAFEVFVGSESRGRSGQFFTPRPVTDLLVQAVAPRRDETVADPACGAGGFLTSVARYYLANGATPEELAASATRFYGIDKDEYLTKLAKLHISLLSGGHPNIVCADSVAMQNGSKALDDVLPTDGFDVLLTNPPFGTRIVAARPEVLRKFELARKWRQDRTSQRWMPTSELQTQVPPQVLFVERCLSLLREGGRLGMVLPESVLSNKSYRYVVEFLLSKADVQAVIAMPEALFKTSGKGGTHTKTCLLIAAKCANGKPRWKSVFMAEAKWCGHDSRARSIPKNDLPEIATNLAAYGSGKPFPSSQLGFVVEKSDMSSLVLCPRYYDPQLKGEIEALRETHDLYVFAELQRRNVLSVSTGDELGKLAYGTGKIPFIRTSDISNWELKGDPKHGVDRSYYDALRQTQDVREHDILMVKDGTYLIGTCAIVTTHDVEIIYQSHLYKIRVNKNALGLNAFLLLAILSSPVVQRQIRSKQFTQDIIDSLGERIGEIIIPIPRSPNVRDEVTDMVRSAVYQRVTARETARQARLKVVGLGEEA